MMSTPQRPHTTKCRRVSFDPIRMHSNPSSENNFVQEPQSSKPDISIHIPNRDDEDHSNLRAIRRPLKRLRDSNTLLEAQSAVLALVPAIHKWMQCDEDSRHAYFLQVHGISILILALKEWEHCPLVVSTSLRILAFLVGNFSSLGQSLVDMGGLRVLVKSISKHHSSSTSKEPSVITACVALLAELAKHMPTIVGSDACLALVVHGLWRFSMHGLLQGFGVLYLERVLLCNADAVVSCNDEPSSSSKNDTWSTITIHQQDTLKKVVLPLLFRIKKYHQDGPNPALCQRADQLLECIHQTFF